MMFNFKDENEEDANEEIKHQVEIEGSDSPNKTSKQFIVFNLSNS